MKTISRRKKVLNAKIVGNRGKSMGKSMIEAGYSEAYATNPKQFLSTKKVQAELSIMEKEQEKIIIEMRKKRAEAKYRDLSSTYVDFEKLRMVKKGESTERIDVTLRDLQEQMRRILNEPVGK